MLQVLYGLAFAWLAYASWNSPLSAGKTAALVSALVALQNIALAPIIALSDNQAGMLMLSNSADYISLPLGALVVLHYSLNWQWQPAIWGRVFLGLAATFELGRRMGYNQDYLLIIVAVWVGVLLTSAALFAQRWQPSQRAILAICGTYLAWMLYSQGPYAMPLVMQAAQTTLFVALLSIYKPTQNAS
ncbi:MAG: hypothetical protein GY881_11010 [Gammaproteobacteria bacterium]|nr:hypothetical protein [Gammaproteobacteria bacterium]MCP4881217.1 hypothetical protein [Gammaproteobacteria bacterium]